jgi:hypothetical protein
VSEARQHGLSLTLMPREAKNEELFEYLANQGLAILGLKSRDRDQHNLMVSLVVLKLSNLETGSTSFKG